MAVLCISIEGSVLADGQGTSSTGVRPPIPDSSLANPNGYNVIKASGGGANSDYAALQAALNTSATRPVMGVGVLNVCQELLIPESGMFVMENNMVFDITRAGVVARPNNYITCTGSWLGGGAFIAFNGHYGTMRGVAVDGGTSPPTSITGVSSIVNADLTATACGVFSLGQTVTGSGIIPDTHIVQTFACSGGTQHFYINNWTNTGAEQVTGLVACVEHLNNAGFTVSRDLYLVRCSGDGYRAVANGAAPGSQGQTGFIIRPENFNGFFNYNGGHGFYSDEFSNGHTTDIVLETVQVGANLRDGLRLRKAGQVQIHQVKSDFNAGKCMELNEGGFVVSDVTCDNNYTNPQIHVILDSTYSEELVASNIVIGNRDATPSTAIGIDSFNTPRLTLSGISSNLQYTFAIYSGTLSPLSSIQSAKTTYDNDATAAIIEPLITRGVGTWKTITPTTAAYLPDLQDGVRNFTVSLGSNCPCTLTNFAHAVPGMRGTINFVQDSTGGRAITFGDKYAIQTIPTITTTSGAITVVSYNVGQDGKVIFAAPVSLGVLGPTIVQANETNLTDNITSGNATIPSVGAGRLLLVRAYWCGGPGCDVGTSTITGITGSGGTCSAVPGASTTTGRNAALWACPNVTSGSKTLAISFNSAAYYGNVLVSEWSNANVAPVDGTTGNAYNMTNTHLINVSTSSAVTAGTTVYTYARNLGSFIGPPAVPPWNWIIKQDATTDCWTLNRCDAYLTNAQGATTASFYNEFTGSDNWIGLIGAFKGP